MANASARAAVASAPMAAIESLALPSPPMTLTSAAGQSVANPTNVSLPAVQAGIADSAVSSITDSAKSINSSSISDRVSAASGMAAAPLSRVAGNVKEGFVNPNGPTSGGCGFKQADFYQVPGFIQKAPPPRGAASVGYGPNITYNPPRANMARSYDYADMVKENYQPRQACNDMMRTGAGGSAPLPKGGKVMLAGDYVNNKEGYDNALEAGARAMGVIDNIIDSSIPVNGMENVSPDGEIVPAIVCNLMTAINRPSHRISMGDPIRGDLAIPPPCGNWFTSSWGTSGLQQGAMHVLGGENALNPEMLALQNTYHPSSGPNNTYAIGGYPVDQGTATKVSAAIGGAATAQTALSANTSLSVSGP